MVNHGEKKTRFSVLTTAAGALSAQALNLTTTDNISDVYPGLASKSRPLFTVSWINEFDNTPGGDGVRKNDATILSAIGYEF